MDEAGRCRIEYTWRLEGARGALLFPSTVDVIVLTLYVSTATRSETDSSPVKRRIRTPLRPARNYLLSLNTAARSKDAAVLY